MHKNMNHGYTSSLSPSQFITTPSSFVHHHYYPTKKLHYISLTHLKTLFIVPNSAPLLRCCYGGDKVEFFSTKKFTNLRKKQRCRVGVAQVKASSRETPYQVLGVSPSATPDQIKRAYRKLALKYHPDVNKQPNAQEKFMRIKHAYNTLLNPDSRRRYDSGNRQSDYTYSSSGRTRSTQEEEEFYGLGDLLRDVQNTLGDFFKDLQQEFENWEANASSQGKPKSLWEELAEIGEEFVEFLEKELNITDQDSDNKNSFESFGGQRGSNDRNPTSGASSIEDSIDEIEATLAQLKKELGL